MKRILFSIAACLISALALQAQPFLYGMTNLGGTNDKGVIFTYDPGSNAYYKLKDFNDTDGANPMGYMLLASNGLLYGTTTSGGGVIFSFNPATNAYTKLREVGSGDRPEGSLMQASNGLIYGTTFFKIFSFNYSTNTYTNLADVYRSGGLIQASDGLLYGTSLGRQNSPSDSGYIFSLDPVTNNILRYNIKVGSFGHLVESANGLLYGLNFDGTIFSFDRISKAYVEIVSAGANAFGGLMKASNGLLYGMTKGYHSKGSNFPGNLFSFDPGTNTYIKLKEFNSPFHEPLGTLMQASDGILYGVMPDGGSNFGGVIFSFNPTTNRYSELKSLISEDGVHPSWNAALTEVMVKPACTPPTFLNNQQIVLDASCTNNNGNISIIPQSGKAPYQYSINGGATYVMGSAGGYTFQGLAPGTYQLRLKDANGCESESKTRTVKSVYGTPAFLNNLQIVLDASCNGNDGSISIIPTCGVAKFMYSINGGLTYVDGPDNGYTFQGLSAGMYKLRLKDSYGNVSAIVTREVKPNAFGNCVTVLDNNVSQPSASSDMMAATVRTYPNPNKGQFKVQLQNFTGGKAEVSIFDAKGTMVQRRQLNINENTSADFNLSRYAAGLYTIKIVSNSGTKVSKIVIE